MSILTSVVSILLALGILITVHEFGHFWVARRNGIRVVRFSIGFGQPLVRWRDRHGTEFVIAWIPLGGYVKMLDEREGPVADRDLPQAYNTKTPLQRIAVASAGPLANFLFAIVAFALLYSIGVQGLAPVVGQPFPDTPAAAAGFERGDQVERVDGRAVDTWRDLSLALARRVGETGAIRFTVERDGTERQLMLDVSDWLAGESEPNPMRDLGLHPQQPGPAEIGRVVAGSAAAEAGLQPGDRVVSVDGQAIENWVDLVVLVQLNGGRPLELGVMRDGQRTTLTVTPEVREVNGERQGYIGAARAPFEWPEEQIVVERVMPWTGVWLGLKDTWEMIELSVVMLGKMLGGQVSFQQIGGPISMAQMAGESVQGGFESFIRFLAFISISLGVINLLPIPVLDGGHILFYGIEWLRGRPLSERTQAIGTQIGLLLVLALMVLAFVNDILRLG